MAKRHAEPYRSQSSKVKAEDLHLENLGELRRLYYKKHPIIIEEILSGKLRDLHQISRRIGCGRTTLTLFLAERREYAAEYREAKLLYKRGMTKVDVVMDEVRALEVGAEGEDAL